MHCTQHALALNKDRKLPAEIRKVESSATVKVSQLRTAIAAV
jgi:hypothetical protein